MFHWICPECGREIAPTVRECPACDPKAVVAEPALVGVVEAPARALNHEASARVLNHEASARVLNHEGPAQVLNHEAPVRTLSLEAPALTIHREAPSRAFSDPGEVPPRAPSVEMLPRAVSSVTIDAPAPVSLDEPDELPQLTPSPFPVSNSLGELAMVIGLLDDATPDPAMGTKVPVSFRALPSELKVRIPELTPAPGTPRQVQPASALALSLSRARPEREMPLVETRAELRLPEARPPVPPAQPPVTPLAVSRASLAAPRGTRYAGPAPSLASLVHYSPLAGRPLRAAAPRTPRPKLDSTRRVTLAGPMLTPALVSFKDRELRPILREARRARNFAIPAWLLRWMIVAVVVLLGVRVTLSTLSQKPAAVAPVAATAVTPAPQASVVSPLSRSIEVTGFRIVADPSKTPEIHYLVVNHTPARVSNMTVYVTLRTADDKAGQPPLSRFSFAAPNLGPFQSKEMVSVIEKMNRPVALPEWQDLRADIEIGQ